jgi:hypothetical protein
MRSNAKEVIDRKNTEVLFIKELDIKALTPISANVVKTSLIQNIVLAQDMYLKKILGTPLFNKLKNQWVASSMDKNLLPDGTGNIPPLVSGDTINYQELYAEIYKPLVWQSYLLSLTPLAIKIVEDGITLNSTEFSESAGLVGLNRLVSEGKMTVASYTNDLEEYLCTTFENKDEIIDSEEVGTNPYGIFTARKPWHKNKYKCNC